MSKAIDNIFIDSARLSSSTSHIGNGLSGHNAQFLRVNNISIKANLISLKE
jgi:hypothetical protein